MQNPTSSGSTHQAYMIPAQIEDGIAHAEGVLHAEFGMKVKGNPDIVVLRYGLLMVEEARRISDIAAQGAVRGDMRAIIIAASRAYHEAQNALLKVFEEPPKGVLLFLIMPQMDMLLPTLRSRVMLLPLHKENKKSTSDSAEEFVKMNKEKRSGFIKKLTSGKDEDERRELRDEALALVNGIEVIVYKKWKGGGDRTALLRDIAVLRGYLHDRSAPVKMILEHIALVLPRHLI